MNEKWLRVGEWKKQADKMKLLSTEISALHKAKTHEMQKVFALCFKLNFQIVDDISELLFLLLAPAAAAASVVVVCGAISLSWCMIFFYPTNLMRI